MSGRLLSTFTAAPARGSRAEVGIWAETLVGSGYIVVSIDYRLAPETKLAELVSDVEDAFRWIP